MLGGILSILFIVILVARVPTAPTDPSALVARFPSVRFATVVGETVYLGSVILWAILLIALYRALRESKTPANFGSGLGLIGIVALVAGGVPAVAFSRISDLYHSSTATPTDQAALAWVWQGTQAIFNETDTMGFILLVLGYILLGVAMLRHVSFGKAFGAVSIVLGLAGLVGISLFSVDSSSYAPFGLIIFVILPLLLGWKVYSLSKAR